MANEGLVSYFENYLKKEPLFKNKRVLQSDYTPEHIEYREDIIKQIAEVFAPALRLEKPSNLFLYGKTGTGKTLLSKYTSDKILKVAESQKIPIQIIYVNCKLKKVADTEYRLIAEIIRKMGGDIPVTGLPTEEVYKHLFSKIDSEKRLFILILDEIDQLVDKVGDEILYSLTRINSELKQSQVSIVGISNNLVFANSLDPRIKSSLSEEEIIFHSYNAIQLQQILRERSKEAFRDGVIEEGVIEKCAAYAAMEHGDARRALELLRVAGELAERQNEGKVQIMHIDEAEGKIERDRILNTVEGQPNQVNAVLFSIFSIFKNSQESINTGEIYDTYKEVCAKSSQRPLTQRRVSDIICELDMLGIINAKTISKGRYGRTRQVSLVLPDIMHEKIQTILSNKLNFG